MKKLLAILLGACLLLGVMSGCGGDAEDAVTVQKVSDITSQGSVGLVNRYAGLVVSGETATVKKGDKKVLETYVQEGDFVTEGDVLMGVSKTRAASHIITKLPYVRQVVVSKQLPGTICFTVVEDTATVAATSEFGDRWLLNDNGKLLETVDEEAEIAYPVITGTALLLPTAGDQAEYDDPEKGKMAMKVLSSLEVLGLSGSVQEICVEDLENVTVAYQERLEVQLGDGSDLDYKFQYMTQAADRLPAGDRGVLDLSFATGSQEFRRVLFRSGQKNRSCY